MFDEVFKVVMVAPDGWAREVGITGKRMECVRYCTDIGWQHRDGFGHIWQLDFVPEDQRIYMGRRVKTAFE